MEAVRRARDAVIGGGCALGVACAQAPVDVPSDDTEPADTEPADTEPADTGPPGLPDAPPPTCPEALAAALAAVATWPEVASCGHLWFQAALADHTLAINLHLASRPDVTTGAAISVDFARPAGVNASLLVHEGQPVAAVCVVTEETGLDPEPTRTWRAVGGVATFTVGDQRVDAFDADLTLLGVVVEEVGGTARCALPDAAWTGLRLGWYPG